MDRDSRGLAHGERLGQILRLDNGVNCPGCGTRVSDGTSICPRCDYIIDDSFLGAAARSQDGEEEREAQASTLSGEEEPRFALARRKRETEEPASIDEQLTEMKRFVAYLPGPDKLAFAGAALTILLTFFPWKETAQHGEVLGIASLGFPVVALALLAISALVIRVKERLPRLNPAILWLGQLGAFCLCALWCLLYIKASWDSRLVPAQIGNLQVPLSRPDFGVVAALLTSILGAGGTVWGMKQQP